MKSTSLIRRFGNIYSKRKSFRMISSKIKQDKLCRLQIKELEKRLETLD